MWMIPTELYARSVILGTGTLAWRPEDFQAIIDHFREAADAPVLLGGSIYNAAMADARLRWRLCISGHEDEAGLREKSYAMALAYLRRSRRLFRGGCLCAPVLLDARTMFSEEMLAVEADCRRAVRKGRAIGMVLQVQAAMEVRHVGRADVPPHALKARGARPQSGGKP